MRMQEQSVGAGGRRQRRAQRCSARTRCVFVKKSKDAVNKKRLFHPERLLELRLVDQAVL